MATTQVTWCGRRTWTSRSDASTVSFVLTQSALPVHDVRVDLPSQFERFLGNISVDQDKLNRIKSAHSRLRRALESDDYVGLALVETFLQGSYVHGTAIRPFGNSSEFDVDVCCLLNLAEAPLPTDEPRPMIRWLERRLKRMQTYRGKVSTRPRCIRIDFPGDFHMDVVPLVEDRRQGNTTYAGAFMLEDVLRVGGRNRNNGNLLVPNSGVNGWEATNPKGLRDWYREQNDRTNGRFTRVVRMLKHWRNQAFEAGVRPPSVGFEVLIANSWPFFANSDAAALSGVLRHVATYYSFVRPTAMNPSVSNEDLLSSWSHQHYDVFMMELSAAADLANEALSETNEGRSIGLWQRLFRTRFPQQGA